MLENVLGSSNKIHDFNIPTLDYLVLSLERFVLALTTKISTVSYARKRWGKPNDTSSTIPCLLRRLRLVNVAGGTY